MARHDGRDSSNAKAGADVAHQVEDAGGVPHFLVRYGIIGDRGERYEQ